MDFGLYVYSSVGYRIEILTSNLDISYQTSIYDIFPRQPTVDDDLTEKHDVLEQHPEKPGNVHATLIFIFS